MIKTETALKQLESTIREINPALTIIVEPNYRTLTLRTPDDVQTAFPKDEVFYFDRRGSWLHINKHPRPGESKSRFLADTDTLCEAIRAEATSDFAPDVVECLSCGNIVAPDPDPVGCGCHCPQCQETL